MQIKAADDKEPQIDTLRALLERSDVDARTRQWIEQEIRTTSAGWKGERDAAYEIEFTFGESPNFATLHDLRLEHNGAVAQIDHLIINRLLQIWVCESKHFAEGVSINEHGEWTRYYNGRPQGMPSPVEQNRMHVLLLERLFDTGAVELPKRLGVIAIRPDLTPVVLVSNSARIGRPKTKVDGIETVIKVEKLRSVIEKSFDERVHRLLTKVIGRDRLHQFATDLAALHRAADVDWAARFGLAPAPLIQSATPTPKVKAELRCHSCGGPVSNAEAFFCRVNKPRFGGNLYCRPCQAQIAPIHGGPPV